MLRALSGSLIRRNVANISARQPVHNFTRSLGALGVAPENSINESVIFAPFVSGEGGVVLCEGVIGQLESLRIERGQDVEVDEVIAVIETDKAAVDIKSRDRGTVTRIHCRLGDDIKEGQPIATIMTD